MLRTAPRLITAALAAAALLTALPAAAQWVWRDANGRVTASDRPPPREVPDKDILNRPQADVRRQAAAAAAAASAASAATATPGSTSAAAPPTALERELEARKRNAEQEKAAQQRADEARLAQQKAENCRRARGHLAALDSGQRIARTNEKGEREILDDKGRADEQRRTREVIAADCR